MSNYINKILLLLIMPFHSILQICKKQKLPSISQVSSGGYQPLAICLTIFLPILMSAIFLFQHLQPQLAASHHRCIQFSDVGFALNFSLHHHLLQIVPLSSSYMTKVISPTANKDVQWDIWVSHVPNGPSNPGN